MTLGLPPLHHTRGGRLQPRYRRWAIQNIRKPAPPVRTAKTAANAAAPAAPHPKEDPLAAPMAAPIMPPVIVANQTRPWNRSPSGWAIPVPRGRSRATWMARRARNPAHAKALRPRSSSIVARSGGAADTHRATASTATKRHSIAKTAMVLGLPILLPPGQFDRCSRGRDAEVRPKQLPLHLDQLGKNREFFRRELAGVYELNVLQRLR